MMQHRHFKAHFSVCCRSLMDFLPRMSLMRLLPDCGLGCMLGPGAPYGGGGPGRPPCLLFCGGGPARNAVGTNTGVNESVAVRIHGVRTGAVSAPDLHQHCAQVKLKHR